MCADDDESPDTEARQHGLEGGVLEGVAVVLLDERLGVARSQFGDDLPIVASLASPRRSAGPHDRDTRRAFSTRLPTFATTVALGSPFDDAVLRRRRGAVFGRFSIVVMVSPIQVSSVATYGRRGIVTLRRRAYRCLRSQRVTEG